LVELSHPEPSLNCLLSPGTLISNSGAKSAIARSMTIQFFAPAHHDLEPSLQTVEIMTFFQIPHFSIIGLPGPEIRESTDRVRSALMSEGFEIPKRKVIINLSPAGLRKQGTGTDLAIALTVIFREEKSSSEKKNSQTGKSVRRILAAGELGLQGSISPSHSVFRILVAAEINGISEIILSKSDADLAREYLHRFTQHFKRIPQIYSASTLREAYETLSHPNLGLQSMVATRFTPTLTSCNPQKMQDFAPLPIASPSHRRILLATATGLHHLLLLGPKGIGKTRSTDWIEFLRQDDVRDSSRQQLCLQEMLSPETRFIESNSTLPVRRVSPHLKPSALVGSANAGQWIPGELQMANQGILIADEFAEWSRDTREALRGPLESFTLQLTSVQLRKSFQCRFQFIATSNLCPCGGIPRTFAQQKFASCRCSPGILQRYLLKLSGPLLDRMDFCSLVRSVPKEMSDPTFESQDHLLQKVRKARKILHNQHGKVLPGQWEANQTEEWLDNLGKKSDLREFLGNLTQEENARSRHKIARMATTLAALDEQDTPGIAHFLEARLHRPETLFSTLIPSSTSPLVRE